MPLRYCKRKGETYDTMSLLCNLIPLRKKRRKKKKERKQRRAPQCPCYTIQLWSCKERGSTRLLRPVLLLLVVTVINYVPKLMTICGAVCVLNSCVWPCSGVGVVWLLLSSFAFSQWDLIAGCGWWVARGRLRVVHGDSELYRRPLSLTVG